MGRIRISDRENAYVDFVFNCSNNLRLAALTLHAGMYCDNVHAKLNALGPVIISSVR